MGNGQLFNGQWERENKVKSFSHTPCPMPIALCPLPYAPCPMPHSPFPIPPKRGVVPQWFVRL
ncbi:hypothetical protein [Tolypothrix sp. VBCCA 56010]|uniref:hypothetical protein n=1 Tax=Tolypothrix sp. VBCCA 56010 TaxID=3137731 RepID=UPI003D7E2206